MQRPVTPPDEIPDQDGLALCVIAFASAVKNLTIYPASHPRVAQRAAEVAEKFSACRLAYCELTLRGEQLVVDGEPLDSNNLAVLWLVSRCRDVGLRGVALERGCTADDVARFAGALVACRPGTGKALASTWEDDTARIRPLELVVEENHAVGSQRQVGDVVPKRGTATSRSSDRGHAALLAEISNRPQVKELLRQIEGTSRTDSKPERAGSLDMLGLISELLPVDMPRDPDELAAAVEHILSRIHGELGELLRLQTQVKGADLLRSAVSVARNYFTSTDAPITRRDKLPTGRPGDEKYGADVGALLTEYETLPSCDELQFPPASDYGVESTVMARELLGIYLFGLSVDTNQARLQPRIERINGLVSHHHAEVTDLLDAYLSASVGTFRLPTTARVQLLAGLAKSGLTTMLRERGYIDTDLLTSGFPEVLPVAPLLFVHDADPPILRRALTTLAPVLANGGAKSAAESGYLNSPATIEFLTRIGGPQVLLLLSQIDSNDPAVHSCLCQFVAGLELPPAAAAVLTHCNRQDIPPSYLRRLLQAQSDERCLHKLRRASGELIRNCLTQGRATLPAAACLALVQALEHAPSEETTVLLQQLSRAGRFFNFTRNARLLRKQARACLATMRTC